MKKPELYKKESLSNVRNRTTNTLSNKDKERTNIIISKFFELFKDTHL